MQDFISTLENKEAGTSDVMSSDEPGGPYKPVVHLFAGTSTNSSGIVLSARVFGEVRKLDLVFRPPQVESTLLKGL